MEERANKKGLSEPTISDGTKVRLDACHIRLTRPSRKLHWR